MVRGRTTARPRAAGRGRGGRDGLLVRLAALAALLVAATLFVHGGMERHVALSLATIDNAAFDADPQGLPEGWESRPGGGRVTAGGGTLRLHKDAIAGTTTVRQPVPRHAGVSAIRVEARVGVEDVRPGTAPLAGAAVYLVGRDPDGALAFGSHFDLARLTGTRTARTFADVFAVSPQAVESVLFIELHDAAGSLEVSDLEVTALGDAPLFLLARAGLAVAWLAGGVAAIALLRRRLGTVRALALGAVAAVGAVLLLLPWELRGRVLGAAQAWLGLEALDQETVADAGHVAIFFALGLVARLVLSRLSWPVALAGLIAIAVLGEVMQLLTDGRTAEPGDVLRNALGAAAGLVVAGLLRLAAARLRAREEGDADRLASEER